MSSTTCGCITRRFLCFVLKCGSGNCTSVCLKVKIRRIDLIAIKCCCKSPLIFPCFLNKGMCTHAYLHSD